MDQPLLRRAFAGYLVAKGVSALAGRRSTRPAPPDTNAQPEIDPASRGVRVSAPSPAPAPLPPMPTRRILGISVWDVTFDEAIARIIAWSRTTPARTVITANLDHVMKLREDPIFQRCYAEADMITADGMPFVWLARLDGSPLKDRVTGSDLILPLMEAAAREGRSVFIFGSTMERLHAAAKAMKERYPRLEFRGAYAPPFGFERDPEIHAEVLLMIRTARPDIILVALGAPKQEIWANAMAGSVRHGVFVSIGGGLDFLSGAIRRAPMWMRRNGIEFVWRALTEPARLGPRYVRIIRALPWLVRMHRRDRAEYEALERRRAMAALSDSRFQAAREEARAADARAADEFVAQRALVRERHRQDLPR